MVILDGQAIPENDDCPNAWQCLCCKKDFKSQGQMENHLQSKKHEAA
jgi:hypothetical protein